MTLDELKNDYPFLKNMEIHDIKRLLLFITTALAELSLCGGDKSQSQIEKFVGSVFKVIKVEK